MSELYTVETGLRGLVLGDLVMQKMAAGTALEAAVQTSNDRVSEQRLLSAALNLHYCSLANGPANAERMTADVALLRMIRAGGTVGDAVKICGEGGLAQLDRITAGIGLAAQQALFGHEDTTVDELAVRLSDRVWQSLPPYQEAGALYEVAGRVVDFLRRADSSGSLLEQQSLEILIRHFGDGSDGLLFTLDATQHSHVLLSLRRQYEQWLTRTKRKPDAYDELVRSLTSGQQARSFRELAGDDPRMTRHLQKRLLARLGRFVDGQTQLGKYYEDAATMTDEDAGMPQQTEVAMPAGVVAVAALIDSPVEKTPMMIAEDRLSSRVASL